MMENWEVLFYALTAGIVSIGIIAVVLIDEQLNHIKKNRKPSLKELLKELFDE